MTTKEYFLHAKIVKGKETSTLELFNTLCPDFTLLRGKTPQTQLKSIWDALQRHEKSDNSINGKLFEYAIIAILINETILPLYVQAKVAFVPNIEFDLLLYSPHRPIALSLKTSLRERYKQADLEAIALKYVHRKGQAYLLTINAKEAKKVNEKILSGDVIGIDGVIDCFSDAFDHFIAQLCHESWSQAGQIDIVTAATLITNT